MGKNLRAERARRGLTQVELANILGVVPMSIIRWETGTSEPDAKNLVRITRFFGCSPEYLLDLVGDPHATLEAAQI